MNIGMAFIISLSPTAGHGIAWSWHLLFKHFIGPIPDSEGQPAAPFIHISLSVSDNLVSSNSARLVPHIIQVFYLLPLLWNIY